MLHKKQTENISINHLNNQTQNPPKKKNLNGALKWNLDKTEKTKKKKPKVNVSETANPESYTGKPLINGHK